MHVSRACSGRRWWSVSLLMLLLLALGAAKEGKQSEMWLVRRLLPSFWGRVLLHGRWPFGVTLVEC